MGAEVTVAVVGPAGLVGREILELLKQRRFPVGSIRLLGTHRTAGAEVELAGRREKIALLTPQAFDGVELAFFAAGPGVAGEHAPRAAAAGAAVIDVSSRFRLDPRSEEHTSELQSPCNLVFRPLLGKKNRHCSLVSPTILV